MGLPLGGLMTAGLGEQAAASELVATRAARGSQDLRTSRDYVPAGAASPADRVTNLLIADRAGGRSPTKLCDWLRRVSQVVRQRSAKPPPRVRIPHSPPFSENDSASYLLSSPGMTATLTATPVHCGAPPRTPPNSRAMSFVVTFIVEGWQLLLPRRSKSRSSGRPSPTVPRCCSLSPVSPKCRTVPRPSNGFGKRSEGSRGTSCRYWSTYGRDSRGISDDLRSGAIPSY